MQTALPELLSNLAGVSVDGDGRQRPVDQWQMRGNVSDLEVENDWQVERSQGIEHRLTTSYPASRSQAMQNSIRAAPGPSAPLTEWSRRSCPPSGVRLGSAACSYPVISAGSAERAVTARPAPRQRPAAAAGCAPAS
jgi:hypothetical protein